MSEIRTARQKAAMTGANLDATRQRDDFYPTPPELTAALLAVEDFGGGVWEPACGDGALSRELEASGVFTVSTDLVDRGYGEARRDFLFERAMPAGCRHIITNPPFKLGEQFWERACELAPGKVAFLCRLTWLEGMKRLALFSRFPLARVWVIPWRPKFQRNRLATDDDASGMLAHAWYVRDASHSGPPALHWISKAGTSASREAKAPPCGDAPNLHLQSESNT